MDASLIKQFGSVPVNTITLKSALKNYRAPMGKIALLQKKGKLLSLKRNLYLCTSEENARTYSQELIANHIVHPSYVSYETILSKEGIIPERVHIVKSACLKRSKIFENPTGIYEYIQVPESYYSIGVITQKTSEGYYFMLASIEKALCDVIVSSAHLRIQSIKAMRSYLEDYLRADLEIILKMNTNIIRNCAQSTNKKKNELLLLERMINYESL